MTDEQMQQILARFDAVDQRFDAVDHRMEALEHKVDVLDGHVSALNGAVFDVNLQLNERMAGIEATMAQRFTQVDERIRVMESGLMNSMKLIGQRLDRLEGAA